MKVASNGSARQTRLQSRAIMFTSSNLKFQLKVKTPRNLNRFEILSIGQIEEKNLTAYKAT